MCAELLKRGPGRPRLDGPSPEFVTRRDEIVAAAAGVFHEKGYELGTLAEIADLLDVRRATVYYYVRSKEYLLFLILERAFRVVLQELATVVALEDPLARLERLIWFQVCTVSSQPALFGILFDHRPMLGSPYEELVKSSERQVFGIYQSIVASAIDAGVVRSADPLYATQAILGMTTWVYKWWKPDQDNRELFAERCVRLVLRQGPRLVAQQPVHEGT